MRCLSESMSVHSPSVHTSIHTHSTVLRPWTQSIPPQQDTNCYSPDHKSAERKTEVYPPSKIYHSKRNKHNTQANKSQDHTSDLRGSARCLRPRGGGKLHYESKDYYKMITEITSLGWWQVEPFRSRNPRSSSRHLRY